MICEKCGKQMVIKSNPKYTITNYEHETHCIYVCENCDAKN